MKEWSVAVFKLKPEKIKETMLDLYHFTESLDGVISLHFMIRDRIDEKLVFSFRVLSEPDKLKIVRSKIKYKLGSLLEKDAFSVDPNSDDPLIKYVAWPFEDTITKRGADKFKKFYKTLDAMSKLVIQMLKDDYFEPSERIELAHVTSWMLGCTEYGLLDTKHWELGYFDRIEGKNYCSLRKDFSQK
jgi:hypothetical protein